MVECVVHMVIYDGNDIKHLHHSNTKNRDKDETIHWIDDISTGHYHDKINFKHNNVVRWKRRKWAWRRCAVKIKHKTGTTIFISHITDTNPKSLDTNGLNHRIYKNKTHNNTKGEIHEVRQSVAKPRRRFNQTSNMTTHHLKTIVINYSILRENIYLMMRKQLI